MIATPPPAEQQMIMVSAILFAPEEGTLPARRVSLHANAVTITPQNAHESLPSNVDHRKFRRKGSAHSHS